MLIPAVFPSSVPWMIQIERMVVSSVPLPPLCSYTVAAERTTLDPIRLAGDVVGNSHGERTHAE